MGMGVRKIVKQMGRIDSKKLGKDHSSYHNPTLKKCEDEIHTPQMGLGSPPGLPKLQNSIAEVKTPRIRMFFISLESY
jgi:hypothetical protein